MPKTEFHVALFKKKHSEGQQYLYSRVDYKGQERELKMTRTLRYYLSSAHSTPYTCNVQYMMVLLMPGDLLMIFLDLSILGNMVKVISMNSQGLIKITHLICQENLFFI